MSDAMEMMSILVPLFGLLLVTGTVGYLAYIGVEVVRRRMLGGASPAEEELEELRHRMAELEEHGPAGSDHELIARVAELEERLDFAERLLAKGNMKALPPEATDEVSVP